MVSETIRVGTRDLMLDKVSKVYPREPFENGRNEFKIGVKERWRV